MHHGLGLDLALGQARTQHGTIQHDVSESRSDQRERVVALHDGPDPCGCERCERPRSNERGTTYVERRMSNA